MHICDWSNLDAECVHLIASVRDGKSSAPPFTFLAIPSSPDDQLRCAKSLIAEKHPPLQKPLWRGEHYRHPRIRIAYVSADFHQHPMSYLLAGMFEDHDRSRFEITAISIGPDDGSEIRKRLKVAFEHFIDATALSDAAVASCIREAETDILVDLQGFTQGARTNIFASRPAPIQVNYLGYPGTTGASYIDYLIADPTLIPSSHQRYYSEKIAYLPNSYMPHDDAQRSLSDRSFNRSEFGLPKDAIVFSCFNNAYKLNPYIFEAWMRILAKVPESVIWLSHTNRAAIANLKAEAANAGVDPARLIFANRTQFDNRAFDTSSIGRPVS